MRSFRLFFAAALMGVAVPALCSEDASADSYRLGVGDKLRIKVHEWPDLSGEYTVGPAATVSLPIIGELAAGGVTPGDLGKTISSMLREGGKLASTPSTAVEIIGFRPVFLMGDVQRPGEYAYRPGLTVLQAISIAGGYYRPTESSFRLERDAITARGDAITYAHEAKRLAARIARLEAEQHDASTIAFPQVFDTSAGSPDLVLMEEERAILAANNEALSKTLQTLDRYHQLYEQEINTVKEQIVTQKRQYGAVQKEFEAIKSLADKGYASLSRQLTSERTIAQITGDIQGLEATILRARQNISQTEQRRIETQSLRTARINADLQKARADASDNAEKLKTAQSLVTEAEVIAPALYAATQGPTATPLFRISRSVGDQIRDMLVKAAEPVLPGDVLTVERPTSLRQQSSQRRDLPDSMTEQRKAAQAGSNTDATPR